MLRGCISLGRVQCDICHRTVPYAERYLVVDQEAAEAKDVPLTRYCLACAIEKGYALYEEERPDKTMTFFVER